MLVRTQPIKELHDFPFYGADYATVVARALTFVHFLFFLLMPWYTPRGKSKPAPARPT